MYPRNLNPLSQFRGEIVELEERLRALEVALASLSATARQSTGSFSIRESQVRRIIAARRIRDRHLGADLVSDPAWDILLEALAAELGDHRIRVSDLCRATNVPDSTTLRWIKKLELDGWVQLHASSQGSELLELTPTGSSKLRALFEALGPSLVLA